jgi:hypothetical protein
MQPGDVPENRAEVDDLMRDIGFQTEKTIEEGEDRFHKCNA